MTVSGRILVGSSFPYAQLNLSMGTSCVGFPVTLVRRTDMCESRVGTSFMRLSLRFCDQCRYECACFSMSTRRKTMSDYNISSTATTASSTSTTIAATAITSRAAPTPTTSASSNSATTRSCRAIPTCARHKGCTAWVGSIHAFRHARIPFVGNIDGHIEGVAVCVVVLVSCR